MTLRCLVFLAALTPTAAWAQAPSDAVAVPSPGGELSDPAAPVIPPEGYGDLTLPDLADRDRVSVYALAWGDRELTLGVHEGDSETPLSTCTAPCRLELAPGRYTFTVQPLGGGPRRADDQPVWISGSRVALQMSYDHRILLRGLGWTFVSLAVTAFGLSWIGGTFSAVLIGTPLAAGFLIPAVPLIFLEDSARVEVTPLAE